MTPPDTERRPVTETHHGGELTDPYRWLEADDEQVASWTDEQSAYAESVLDTPVRDALRDRFEDVARVTDYGSIRPAGDRYLQRVEAPDEDHPVVSVRETPSGEGRVVVDPNELSDDGTVSVDWIEPSPDGDLLAYGVAEGGDEQYDIEVVTLPEGRPVETIVGTGRSGDGSLAWTDEGFYYGRTGTVGDGDQLDREVRFHAVDPESAAGPSPERDPPTSSPGDDRLVVDDFAEQTMPTLVTEGDDLVIEYSHGWERSDVYYLHDGDLVPVVEGHDESFSPTLQDGTCYLLTTHDAPRSRLLACDLDRVVAEGPLDPAGMREVVSESAAVLRSVTTAGDDLLIHRHRDAVSELALYAAAGTHRGDLPVPEQSSVAGVHADDAGCEAFFTAQSFVEPTRVCRVDLDAVRTDRVARADGSVTVLDSVAVAVDADLTVTREWVTSTDGAEIPAFVVHRSDLDPAGDAPTVLYGYGGFRINLTPWFDRFCVPFLEAGGVFVSACLRGGSEFGEAWHDAGRRERKPQTFADAEAVAEALVDRGYTRPERLAVRGGSNGGLLVTALLARRPDLFGAAVAQVPLTDMLRFHELLIGALWTREYGDPDVPEEFAWLRDYSPYHTVDTGAYPPTMLTTGAGDSRVHPGHARKFTARLQACQRGDAPVILRSADDVGHGVGKPTRLVVDEQADVWGFLCSHLGVDADDLR
jgi:prolyl oligopeptidase